MKMKIVIPVRQFVFDDDSGTVTISRLVRGDIVTFIEYLDPDCKESMFVLHHDVVFEIPSVCAMKEGCVTHHD